MKKLIFLFAMVLAVSMAIAQNTSDTKQIGDLNQITVEQTGSGNLVGRLATPSSDVTFSSQTGDENEATVTQSGTDNTAFFEQGISYKYPGTLSGDGENFGNGNEVTVSQTGAKNLAWTYSLGNENIVSVTQSGNGTVDDYNSAGSWLWGNSNFATQSQTSGIGNYSYVAANSSENEATINQVGTDNEGTTSQGWIGYLGHNGNTATILQTGNRNKVELADGDQFVPSLPGYTPDLWGWGIQQYGLENISEVTQSGDDNQAAVYQFGDGNDGTISQLTDWNDANLIQLGDDNSAAITQENGDSNVANLKQTDGGDATILQQGTGNVVKGLGADDMATSFDGSILDVTQIGTTNILNLQQADGASATVYQNGTSNVSTVIQNAN